jgi:Phosphoesterase family
MNRTSARNLPWANEYRPLMPSGHPSSRRPARLVSALVALLTALIPVAAAKADVGLRPGKIKHVWLIILENKSYDATFTGLNRNTYLWRTLPSQGVLLKNYHGTGHGSLDNYTTLVSGQATEPDLQSDCPYYNTFAGHVDKRGSLRSNPNYGQMTSAQGPNGAVGSNGCVYPANVPTLFKQLDAAHLSWKGYAQDLGNPTGIGPPHDAGVRYCGAPYRKPGRTGTTNQPNPGAATASSQYLPKHFPFPWFDSVLRSGDCDARHIANVFSPRNGLYHDLQRKSRTPAFSWITPNMCNDGHDAVCHGNNLSGGFRGPTRIRPPRNYTGGLYAADLFLAHVIPEIEASPAFKDGGLIDITFDEAFPPFTFTGNSFANSTLVVPNAATSIANDAAAQTLFGRRVHFEPPGPNTPLAKDSRGNALYPGPGNNLFLDRPSNCVQQTIPPRPRRTCLLGAAQHVPGPRTDASATAPTGSPTIADNDAVITDRGRSVSGAGIPAGAFVGTVTNTFVQAPVPAQNGGFVDTGMFTLVDSSQRPLHTTGPVSRVTLGARTPATDPLYDATHSTGGGGDTGSVLISPYIRPGSVSTGFYNHYSWLRTIEDLLNVRCASRGLDGQGHLGYAAQRGLAPFGRDVFNRPQGRPVPRSSRYGGIPGWLRAATPRLDAVPAASARHPALAVQGDTVAVDAGGARLRATAVGPTVGGTFVLTLWGASHAVSLTPAAFTVLDEFGQPHHPQVSAAAGGATPRILRPGQTVRLILRAQLPVGNGRLQWAPDGWRAIVAWDFDVELD